MAGHCISSRSPHEQHPNIATMADEQPATQPPAAEAKDLHTDPVTGEKISKSELKRRQKQREKYEKKKEKAAALPVQTKKEKKDDVEELNPNVRLQP